jgi:hypothetical protein
MGRPPSGLDEYGHGSFACGNTCSRFWPSGHVFRSRSHPLETHHMAIGLPPDDPAHLNQVFDRASRAQTTTRSAEAKAVTACIETGCGQSQRLPHPGSVIPLSADGGATDAAYASSHRHGKVRGRRQSAPTTTAG